MRAAARSLIPRLGLSPPGARCLHSRDAAGAPWGLEYSKLPPVTETDIAELNRDLDGYGDISDSKSVASSGREGGGNDSGNTDHTSSERSSTAAHSDGERLTHVNEEGKASMVDVGQKSQTSRVAVSSGMVSLGEKAFALVRDNQVKKGDVLSISQLAGIMGAKATSQLIPLCHNIFISSIDVKLSLDHTLKAVKIESTARTIGSTGVEMEALTATSVAALTVYDMCKAVSKDIVIHTIQLDHKSGGKSGDFTRESS